jgi:predicted oxidoreductase
MDALSIPLTARALGPTHLRVFPLAYGCWRFAGTSVREAREKLEAALAVGIDLFDHADIYGGEGAAEDLFGRVLAESPGLRQRMLLATKGGIVQGVPYDTSPAHVAAACEGSLKRLRTDVIDLYQLHRPDLLVHPRELAGTLERLRREGKIREVGVSNFTRWQFDALQRHLSFPIAVHQPEFSPLCLGPLRDGVLDQCLERDVTPLAWSPFARGRLGLTLEAARREPEGERLAAVLENLDILAEREGVSRAAVVLAWILVHPSRPVPIIGTQRLDRIRASADAFKVHLTRRDWYAVLEAAQGEKLP